LSVCYVPGAVLSHGQDRRDQAAHLEIPAVSWYLYSKDALASLDLAFSGSWVASSLGLRDLDAYYSVLVEGKEENHLLPRKW